jgi:hypothetical protein
VATSPTTFTDATVKFGPADSICTLPITSVADPIADNAEPVVLAVEDWAETAEMDATTKAKDTKERSVRFMRTTSLY